MALPKTTKPLQRSLSIVPGSIDKEKRTIQVDFGTDTPILMRGWDGSYYEVLSFNKEHVRMDRLNSGAPFLRDHRSDKQIGVIETADVDGTKGVATVRFGSSSRAEKVFQDVADGIRKAISVGYRVYEYVEKAVPNSMREASDYIPTYIATNWEPYEISSVSIPADYKAGVRSENELQENEIKITPLNFNTPMTDEEKREMERLRALEKNPAPATVEQIENARKQAIKDEQKRSADILLACRKSNLNAEFAETLITEGKTVDEARAAIIDEYSKEDSKFRTSVVVVTGGIEDCEKISRGLSEALESRVNPAIAPTELAKKYRNFTLGDMCRTFLESRGVKTEGWDRKRVAMEALGFRSGGAMASTDLPYILGSVFNNMLLRAYKMKEPTFKPFCRESTSPDFRDNLRTRMGALSGFKKVTEGGEYEMASFGDKQEKYKVAKFGVIVPITWESIVNDTLDAFSRMPATLAQKGRQIQSKIVWDLMINNGNMADGVALFHATHKNLITTAAINIDSLSAQRKAMREQTDESGDYIDVEPKYLIVAPELEQIAYQYTSANYTPNTAGTINPKFNQNLVTIVEPRLSALNSGLSWFLAADPADIDTIEYGFLEGQGEMFTETRQGFNTDGIEMKARMVFGAGVIDFRGMNKNIGQ